MTTLTDALNRIMTWIERTHPGDIDLFFPGLARHEVDDIAHKIIDNSHFITPENHPISLPSELYELYKWRNGHRFYNYIARRFDNSRDEKYQLRDADGDFRSFNIFDGKAFFPLETTFGIDLDIGSAYLVLFQHDEDGGDYLILDLKPPFSLHTHYFSDPFSYVTYSNLTALMLTLAEFYESGGDENDVIEFSKDYQRVWLKYNADIGQEAIERVLHYRYVE
jgi:hypothetical protein